MVLIYLPLVVVWALCLLVVLTPVSSRIDRVVSVLALELFGNYVARDTDRRSREIERMQAAHIGDTHRRFAARTMFISAVFGLAGSVIGVYAAGSLLVVLDIEPRTIRESVPPALSFLGDVARLSAIDVGRVALLVVGVSVSVGLVLAVVAYWARWVYLDQVAQARRNAIDASLPRTVAFIYALSRSGMPFPSVLKALSENQDVYGEAAKELAVAVREMETFGTDVVSALETTAERTPSEDLEEFAENLANVLASGQSLAPFFKLQYERYQEEVEAQQDKYLDLLAAFAEIYVTVLVAGPLFGITVLVIIGLVISDTTILIQIITYLGIPLASFGFMVYIDSITGALRGPGWKSDLDIEQQEVPDRRLASVDSKLASDGGMSMGERAALARLDTYDRLTPIRRWLKNPLEQLLARPTVTLYFSVPLALLWLLVRVGFDRAAPAHLVAVFTSVSSLDTASIVARFDGPLVEVSIVVLGLVAVVYEARKRRYRGIEDATPDFLDRMASVNEAGLTAIESIERVARTDLGYLSDELERAASDIRWGADASTALHRMANRAHAPSLHQSMTLIGNAMRVSGDISPVLRIAANEAQGTRQLRSERRQEMVIYLLVIYLSFFVFLGIIVALTVSFIPAIEEAANSSVLNSDTISVGIFAGLRDVETGGYQLLFFHISAVQAVCSGLVAGQLGEGSVYDGLKHAAILLLIAYLVFGVL